MEEELPYESSSQIRLLVGRLVGPIDGWAVYHNFLKGREVTLHAPIEALVKTKRLILSVYVE